MALPTLVPVELPRPPKGEAQLDHDQTFEAIDGALTTMRDIANRGIDAVNHVGAGLRRLPEGDLYGLIIAPLVGDHATIQQNTAACLDVRDALHDWGDNLLRISLAVEPSWGGEAASAYLLRVNALGLAARAVGETVRAGAVVFEGIARFSERIGIQVEHLLVALGRALISLARKLLTRVSGPAGWAAFAAELALKGLDAVTDIITRITVVIDLINALRELYHVVKAWVEGAREGITVFDRLPALVRP